MRTVVFLCLVGWAVTGVAETWVYFGTYTRGQSGSEGVYVSTLDEVTGAISPPVLAAKVNNPSFVAIHPNGKTLYAACEADAENGGVAAFSINDDGRLTKLNQRSTGGGGACHVAVDPTGQCVGVANYGGGSCASFSIRSDGSLGEIASFHQHAGRGADPKRQSAPHAHSINFNSTGTQAFVADLGTDKIMLYDVDLGSGKLTPSQQPSLAMPAGGGPRHFCFVPAADSTFNAAVSNLEMTSQVALLSYDADARRLTLGNVVSTLPADVDGVSINNSTAECLVHPNGATVYVSNRGHNSIAMFHYDSTAEQLTPIGHQSTQGEIPRGFGIDPSGRFLVVANQKSGNIISLKVDPETGTLTPAGSEVKLDSPVNVRFLVR
ncbi:lactonase family protein [Stieleria sp. TO1_6]|uniref:lactonase family protein n=1 Tax=Stieleria tagensis TaxID=2956795 RepID=UPI00209B1D9E|nr:lactonase family protein [Stieleria tagensis]MCO8120455.1 lactonase family protein [Stieleria tagensis]